MDVSNESRRTLAQLTARNMEISRLLDAIRSKKMTDEARAREAALRQEFDANEAIIKRLTGGN